MMIAFIVALSLGLSGLQSGKDLASGVGHDRSREIAGLLKHLAPTIANGNDVWIDDAGPETTERVRAQLVLIANESPSSRESVIEALRLVLNDPKGEFDIAEVGRWRFAVALLGELHATEAIDDLVRKINWTSYSGWPRLYPVRAALVRIGGAAVPRLLSALSDRNPSLRWEASEALAEIGQPSVDGLLDVLAHAGPSARTGAAHALAVMGGARAREAIEIALRVETDEEAKKHLEYAVIYIDHENCMKDSSKCK